MFALANAAVLPAWLLLLVAPRWHMTRRLVPALFALPLAGLYVYLLLSHWGESAGDFNSLEGIASLFSNPWALLAGWVHYLAFDLFVGSWIARDARRAGLPHVAVVPCLLLSFLFGPAGLLLYWVIRTARLRQLDLGEA